MIGVNVDTLGTPCRTYTKLSLLREFKRSYDRPIRPTRKKDSPVITHGPFTEAMYSQRAEYYVSEPSNALRFITDGPGESRRIACHKRGRIWLL